MTVDGKVEAYVVNPRSSRACRAKRQPPAVALNRRGASGDSLVLDERPPDSPQLPKRSSDGGTGGRSQRHERDSPG